MTIGADMPLRSPFDALVRDKGKDRGNDQEMPKSNDVLDFKTIVKIALPKLKLDTDDAADSAASSDVDKAAEPDKDRSSATASVQNVFGQTILAFEQLLQRQEHRQGSQEPVADAELTQEQTGAMSAPSETVLAAIDQGVEYDAPLPHTKPEKPVQATTKPMPREATPDLSVKQEKAQSLPAPVPTQGAANDAAAAEAEAPDPRSIAKVAVEQSAPIANASVSTPPVPLQAEVKLAATPAPATPQLTTHLKVQDVQILSDRTTGAARTLVIQLQPIELGTVTARLRLTSEGMHIQLTAESRAMADHLAKDHDTLGKALQRAGIGDDASSITISVVDRSSTSANTQTGQQNPSGQEQQAGSRANGQGHSAFQGTPGDRSTNQQSFGDILPDEREEKLARTGIDSNLSRGLVV
ncbi:MAG: flagellar hook-length control protein FliK [Phyllobacterium sp.]|uniref:flagellar hook-length control protein FliK n=1 Tax=Phyllobacterium sp. TaxID=1871046 RepID=UPI0030F08F14